MQRSVWVFDPLEDKWLTNIFGDYFRFQISYIPKNYTFFLHPQGISKGQPWNRGWPLDKTKHSKPYLPQSVLYIENICGKNRDSQLVVRKLILSQPSCFAAVLQGSESELQNQTFLLLLLISSLSDSKACKGRFLSRSFKVCSSDFQQLLPRHWRSDFQKNSWQSQRL